MPLGCNARKVCCPERDIGESDPCRRISTDEAPPIGKPVKWRASEETNDARIWEEALAKGSLPGAREATAEAQPWRLVG